jgi:TolB protein
MALRAGRSILGAAIVAAALAAAQAASGAATRWIVFSAQPGGAGAAQLFRVQATGGEPQQITTGSNPATDPAFSPDGKRLVFVRLGSGLFRVNLDGTGLKRLTSGARDSFPVWSPDGRRIAFLRPYRTQWTVHIMPASGGKARRLPLAPPAGRPSWSADGKTLLLPTAADISTVDARTGRVQKRVTAVAELSTSQAATVSPDGRSVAYIGRRPLTGPSDCGESPCPMFALYLASAGGRKRHIANDTGPAGWAPDGKTMVFVSRGALTLLALGSGKKTTIAAGSHAAGDAPPAWQPR